MHYDACTVKKVNGPARDGKMANLFLQCTIAGYSSRRNYVYINMDKTKKTTYRKKNNV
jgi:hypothetical protein